MSVMDKFLDAMKLKGDDDEYFDDDSYYDNDADEDLRKAPVGKDDPSIEISEEKSGRRSSSRRASSGAKRSITSNGMEVCVFKPTSVEDSREITDTLLDNRTVVLNLEGLDVDMAQRIIDFASGSCYAMRGNLQKISRYIFIITPASVDISGDFQEMIGGSLGDSVGRESSVSRFGL